MSNPGGGDDDYMEEEDQNLGPRSNISKTCYNCGEAGHLSRDCNNPRLEGAGGRGGGGARDRIRTRRCFNCGRMGHISADCKKPAGNKSCYNCGQEGHIARDCPAPRNDE